MRLIHNEEKDNKGTVKNNSSYKYNNRLIKGLEQYFPDLITRLRYPGNPEMIQKIEEEIGEQLPEAFKELYAQFDGEKDEFYTGTILGLSLLPAETILNTIKELKNDDYQLTSMNTGIISEADINERILIPFAFDSSRSYIALDLSLDVNGTKGQVITLDYDCDTYYLLADSLEHFYDFVLHMMEKKKCVVTKDDERAEYFEFETGHFFNVLDDLLTETDAPSVDIELPENFWQNHFKKKIVSTNVLQKEKRLFIKDEMISFAPLKYMRNLRELIIHDSTIIDFTEITHAIELRTIFLVGCQFDENDLEALAKLPNLKELHLGCMDFKNIQCLINAPSLKILGLRKLEQLNSIQFLAESKSLKILELEDLPQINIDELEHFKKLQELSIKEIEIDNLNFLQNMKDIKKLELPEVEVENLNFLKYLKKLTAFELKHKAKEESGLQFLPNLKKLKEFNYPVADLKLYESCEKLETIGIDVVNMCNVEYLKDSNIYNVKLYGVKSETELKQISEKLEQYITLQSYSWEYNH